MDEVKAARIRLHLVAGADADDLHWDMEIDEEDILDMNSQHRSKYQRCMPLEAFIAYRWRASRLPANSPPIHCRGNENP